MRADNTLQDSHRAEIRALIREVKVLEGRMVDIFTRTPVNHSIATSAGYALRQSRFDLERLVEQRQKVREEFADPFTSLLP